MSPSHSSHGSSHDAFRRLLFWMGSAACTAGVLMHLPMYVRSSAMGYRMVGMPMDRWMLLGMGLIVAGLVMSTVGLVPKFRISRGQYLASPKVAALDQCRLSRAHFLLIATLAVAVTLDIMKPTAIAFVMPGMSQEYGLRSPVHPGGSVPVALLPVFAITGTVLGSFIWGWLGDLIGRRASILLAAMNFISTSICGAMPDYRLNFAMCFIMGIGVGGMLPTTYTLIAETIPARHRGWLMVLIGGDIAAAYITTSWISATLVPIFSWRILWLIGLPSGVLLLLLSRWIPESPRFLYAIGQGDEADRVMRRYGAAFGVTGPDPVPAVVKESASWWQLFRGSLQIHSLVLLLLGIGAGVIVFGFNLWIPSNLRRLGMTNETSDLVLRDAALIGFPFTFLVAWLYGFWSAKKTVIILLALTTAAIAGIAIAGDSLVLSPVLLHTFLVVPIWGVNTVTAVVSVYATELYPLPVRSRGSGLTAAATKFGGVVITAIVAFGVAAPSISTTTLVCLIPLTIGSLLFVAFGIETKSRKLEELSA
jgi:putative MFS transporter